MRRILLIMVLCLLAVASTGCKKARLRAQLKELMSSTIVLPEKISCVYNGEVFPMPDSLRDKAKLFVYIDSTECSKCRISRFIQYDPFFAEAEASSKYEVMLLLSFKEGESEEIIEFLTLLELPFPVFIDIEHLFSHLNPLLPSDYRFHSMLLDRRGRPLFFGDPVSNDKARDLFYNRLSEMPS